jgi:hypothetical protein
VVDRLDPGGHAPGACLAALDVVEVETTDGIAVVLPDDEAEEEPVGHSVVLLPALDPTAMGWTGRAWYLGPHREALFDRAGNVGPTVWSDGRIVGGWAQRKDGTVVHRLLERLDKAHLRLLDHEVARLAELLGPARVTPRFRTPLERELVED